ncbi:hypothetical protein [Paenibacillus methanolicus]|uniref:Lipase (Class 3) n=1 Tax=Paenibacillus methanolicus TaxID=582686 RepID=A0A5S5CKF7_9BACL|nr:hypothetical protein [Paenibacillus methanolicus]TYP79463.1 hypothetical protein BCM02_101581 [Paenibacillus methanolicus]
MMEKAIIEGWDVYLLAGIGSTRAFFTDCKAELAARLSRAGKEPAIRELFPYGDQTQSMVRQIYDVHGDLSRVRSARLGGRSAAQQVRERSLGKPVLLIGHSGGGVAAYQAASMLADEGDIPDFRVVQLGSPRVPIRQEHKSRVSYFYAVDEALKYRDPITRIGTWGGWSRSKLGLLYWDRRKYAPAQVATLTLLGGHPHYFRSRAPYVHHERGSNLSLTLNAILGAGAVAEAREAAADAYGAAITANAIPES